MNYRQAIAYLESLGPHTIRPGLERIRTLLAHLGDPHLDFPSVLVGGTNGKGSVVSYLASILREAGCRPGVYTSPHLVRFEERIEIAGVPIAEQEVADLTGEIRAAIEAGNGRGDETPTYFEATTALAFLHQSRHRVRVAILEVGMGGRFDATNVVAPIACAITPVAMDHIQWLGDTLADIAWQKAGILRRNVPAVISQQEPDALTVIRAEAERVGAPLTLTSSCEYRPAGSRERYSDPPLISLTTPRWCVNELRIALRGDHQAENAAAAVLLAGHLPESLVGPIGREQIGRGIARAFWPGRIELLRGRPDLLLDGAHNTASSATLASYLREHQSGRRISLVFAAMKDKPVEGMLDILCPLANQVVVTALPVARGASPSDLERMAQLRHPRVHCATSVRRALDLGREAAGPEGLCIASGSLYLVGEVKKILSRAG